MKTNNIKQIIVDLFRQNWLLYPEDYKEPKAAKIMAIASAKSYWDNRNEIEIERDKEAGVKFKDYRQWILDKLKELEENK